MPDKELDIHTTFGDTRVYRYGDGARTVVLLSGMAGSAASMAPYVGTSAGTARCTQWTPSARRG